MRYYYLVTESPKGSGKFIALQTYDNYGKAWRDWKKHAKMDEMKLIQAGYDIMNPKLVDSVDCVFPVRLEIRDKRIYAVKDGWRVINV